jgi:hypothetical protein
MPLVSQTFDQLLDFTRTTAATFVGSNGLVQNTPASVNLLLWTQQFDNAAWENQLGGTGVACVTTANAGTAPDDTSTADRLQFSLAGGTSATDITRRRQGVNTPATTHTYSVYLRSTDGTSTYNMHLTDANGATRLIIVTGSWQRFSVSAVGVAGTVFYSIGLRGGQSPANSNTADVLAWGAQLEAAATATTYTRNNGGVYPPRFDYDPVTLAPKGILIEEQRTNLLLRSEEFDNAAWTKLRATVTANATTSPDGTADAEKLVEDTTASDTHFVLQTATVSASTAYTYSVLLKAAERTRASLQDGGGSSAIGYFDLSNGTVVSASGATATITNFGNGWYRCTITFTTGGAQTIANCRVFLVDTGTNITYTGNGTSGLFLWGAQLEAGAFATSYIPTVASQVTRTADQCSIVAPNFAPWYNQSEGTFVCATTGGNPSTGQWAVSYDVVGAGNDIYVRQTSATAVSAVVNTAGSSGFTITSGAAYTSALAYKLNDCAFTVNGGAVSLFTATPTSVTSLVLGSLNGTFYLNKHIRSIRYYPVRLSDAQLQALSA